MQTYFRKKEESIFWKTGVGLSEQIPFATLLLMCEAECVTYTIVPTAPALPGTDNE